MKLTKQTLVLFFVGFMGVNTFAQEEELPKVDIAIRASIGYSQQVSFEYRKPINEQLKLNIGADYGGYSSWPGTPKVIDANATEVKFESTTYHEQATNLRFGIERSFKKYPAIYAGAHLVGGYRAHNTSIFNYRDTLTPDNQWATSYDPQNQSDYISYSNHFITTGLMLMLGWDVPISERFTFNLNVNQTMLGAFQVGTPVTGTAIVNTASVNMFISQSRLGLGLRYSFK